jgi:uncharacterized membrane protein
MRQLLIQVPQESGSDVMRAAERHGSPDAMRFHGANRDHPTDLVILHIANSHVEHLLHDLQNIPGLRIALTPRGVIALQPPPEETAQQVVDVTPRSPLEIFLGGRHSVGSWTGFLGYAAAAGGVVWIGLFINTILLTAAMLIAPFAGPAMNAALATARGDLTLLSRALLRYVASLALTVAVAAALSVAFHLRSATEHMVMVSQISSAAVLLPLIAGAAGALNLVQSERNSLVSGAAVGLLVAASLAPPAGLIGMASVIGEWQMVVSGAFLLALQLVGINLSGTAVFRWYGLSARGARYDRGQAWVTLSATLLSMTALASLLTWQFWNTAKLQRSSVAERAAEVITQVVNQSGITGLVESNVRFTNADIQGQYTLLGVVYMQSQDKTLAESEFRRQLLASIHRRLAMDHPRVTPVINLTVLRPLEWSVGPAPP